MNTDNRITLFYSPQTRASGIRVILEELGAPYDLAVMNMKIGENRQPEFLAVNPLGKVPTIRHHGSVITEQVAKEDERLAAEHQAVADQRTP